MDSKTRAEIQSIRAQNGLRTRNELRKEDNMPRKDGADDLTVQVNLTPAQSLGEMEKVGGDNGDGLQ